MGKVEDNKRQKRIRLLETARAQFLQKGLGKTSVSDIVDAAGMAKGTFYLYFKDKYDIRNKLVAYESGKIMHAAYAAVMQDMPLRMEDRILAFVSEVLDQLEARQDLLSLISRNLSWAILKKEVVHTEIEEELDVSELFHRMTSEAGLSQKQSEIMLFMIVELIGASCYSPILYQEPCSLEEYRPYLYHSIRGIIRQFINPEEI